MKLLHAVQASVATFIGAMALSTSLFALDTGSTLPSISIESKGEIILKAQDPSYQNWNSEQLKGKVRTIQHIAGRSSAKKINQPFIEAIKAAQLDPSRYQTTTIINLDDAIFGTASIVKKKAETKKAEYPHSSIVVDEKSSAIEPWGLSHESSAIIVLDEEANVLFFKDGALTPDEISTTLAMIKKKTGQQ